MALVKYNNNSISAITTTSLATGNLVPISEQTASGSASISFTSGIDSTYPIYKFEFINMHPATDAARWSFQGSTNGGSSYGVTMTTTAFAAYHGESDTFNGLAYNTSQDLAQSTSFKQLVRETGNDNDQSCSGTLYIYNPSSTTFVKHFISRFSDTQENDAARDDFTAGYFNTTSAINAFQFKFDSGNIDAGTIKLYGIKDS